MDLNSRFDVMVQAVTIAQKNGVFTLDEAVAAKGAIDNINSKTNLGESIGVLAELVQEAQHKGAYSLQDAHYIYMAFEGIEDEVSSYLKGFEGAEGTDGNALKKSGKKAAPMVEGFTDTGE